MQEQLTPIITKVQALVQARDFAPARQLLQTALKKTPDFFLYHEYLGDVFQAEGDGAQARAAYRRAQELRPSARWIADKMAALDGPAESGGFPGRYLRYPDQTGKRKAEGGRRMTQAPRQSRPDAPLVTIVTAVYDNDDSLQRCIDSVQAQTYDNVEHVIVDGGSPEGTLAILRANDAVLDYYVSEPDRGIYSAMNKGIELAQGDYICLLNSDDFYEPDFVAETVRAAREAPGRVDIVYTDYTQGENRMVAQPIGAGVLLGHLNICHNTFLAHRDCYERIGRYDEDLRIVSDAVWIREAYLAGAQFLCLNKPLFTLIEGGMSSGNTEARRLLFIREASDSYRRIFPELTPDEAEELYLFRFNKKRAGPVLEIARRRVPGNPLLRDALREYVEYCFGTRGNFGLHHSEADSLFGVFVALCDLLGASKKTIRINTKNGTFPEILTRIDEVVARRKPVARKTILHFVTVFSAPSETFIYDLLQRLDAVEDFDNFVLYEHEKMAEERPFDKKYRVPWNDFAAPVAQQIYKYFIEAVQPDLVIAHFAINEHRLHERIKDLDLQFPTLVMTHGIDVFSLKLPSDYTDYVTGNLSRRPDVAFTAVSNYLKNELEAAGVSQDKITILPNSVNPRFFAHRKTSGFFKGGRTLKLLNIGRLIDWKGHGVMLDALAMFRDRCSKDVHLTIVYGNGDERLPHLTVQAERLGLQDHVTFEPFVDFGRQPDYLAGFDIYVHPSSYSKDSLRKSETFGVAVLEAIAAGLPVLSSDAGGLPEVIGAAGPHAQVIRHGNARALCEGLERMYHNPETFTDNIDYARDRLAAFAPERQTAAITRIIDRISVRPARVALFSTSTIQGAGYAAYRLHKGLRDTRFRPTMFTTVRNHENEPDVTVLRHPSGDNRSWSALQKPPKPGLTIMSLNQTHIPSADLLRMVEPYDIVNLHWHARFLSAENIAALTHSGKPVVMTIRDMLPITGGCHFFHGCEKWLGNCGDCPQIDSRDKAFPARVLAAKRAHYDFSNLTLVALSRHSREILKRAPYFKDCRIEHIPNSIETEVFKPHDKARCRAEFGLPADRKIIGYVPSFSSEVKGYRELLAALKKLDPATLGFDPYIMLVGNKTPATDAIEQDKKVLGYIGDNEKLARAFSCADLIVVPSLEETFSNTAAEAIACGVPVVGFRTGAIPDLAVNGKTGFTCEVGDVDGLAGGIRSVLQGPDLGAACRAHAVETLSFMKQARAYESLYADLLGRGRAAGTDRQPRVWDCFPELGMGLNGLATERILESQS
ncbi:glycosyltransferase [Mameliella alba]|nr:glycosyltransferase [Antarctobacter heliothermus]MBY6147163.1 glycosyltransferase [Mameliella alba]MCA0957200.1 glycosyltransferase [Mameliella alba]